MQLSVIYVVFPLESSNDVISAASQKEELDEDGLFGQRLVNN